MKQRKFLYPVLILLLSLGMGFFNLPDNLQKTIFPWTPPEITGQKVSLGLDLQGGSQLDYKIDLRKVPEADRKQILDGVVGVITKRVNSLGVSEPNIYTSTIGDEQHIIVELAGIRDLEQAKSIVGKTIQLEFKEARETPDPDHRDKVKAQAEAILAKVKSGDFKTLGQEEQQANVGKIFFLESPDFQFRSQIPTNLGDALFPLKPGDIVGNVVESQNSFTIVDGNAVAENGYSIMKLTDKQNVEREIKTPKTVKVSQILVQYKGANTAAADITRSKEEAKVRAEEALNKLKSGAKFEDIVKEYSDDKTTKDKDGVSEVKVSEEGNYESSIQNAVFAIKNVGELTEVVEAKNGYYIFKPVEINEAKTEKKMEDQIKFQRIYLDASDDPWIETGLNGQFFQRADVMFDQKTMLPIISIKFNEEGGKKFEELTEKNVGKQIAIFVGGQLITAPSVSEKISGGDAVINNIYDLKTAHEIAKNLNTGAIPAPIYLVGQYSIGASLGQDALSKSLQAGAIGLILVALFMIILYRLNGLIASVALVIYTIVLLFLVKSALPLEFALPFALAVFIFISMKILNSKDSTPEKLISFVVACFLLMFLTSLLANPVVMTLAGIAGVILSIGMAVDANILIFERIKEELRHGRSLSSAVEIGFDRAWNSIRDSNYSSLITCAILFYFGSSQVQGFAFNLA